MVREGRYKAPYICKYKMAVTAASLRQLSEPDPKEEELGKFIKEVLERATVAALLKRNSATVASITAGYRGSFFKIQREGPDTFVNRYLYDGRDSRLVWIDPEAQQQFESQMVEKGFTIESYRDRVVLKW